MTTKDEKLKSKIYCVLETADDKLVTKKVGLIIAQTREIVTQSPLKTYYRILGKKGEGTFSEVLKCQSVRDGQMFACKKMKQKYETIEQVCNLREVQAMRRLNPHNNIVELFEIIFDKRTGTVALVCELMEMNLYELIKGRRKLLLENQVKKYIFQLLKGLEHMHKIGIFHRDVKPENILLKNDNVKLADFGSVRSCFSRAPYTEYISTRWYRAPECLLTDGYYSYKMDLWSVGCCFHELLCLHPLFPGQNEIDQVAKIHDILGTPEKEILDKFHHRNHAIDFNFPTKQGNGIEKYLTHISQAAIDVIYKLCDYDYETRITAKQALHNIYFKDLRDLDRRKNSVNKLLMLEQESKNSSFNNSFTPTTPSPRFNSNSLKNKDKKQAKVHLHNANFTNSLAPKENSDSQYPSKKMPAKLLTDDKIKPAFPHVSVQATRANKLLSHAEKTRDVSFKTTNNKSTFPYANSMYNGSVPKQPVNNKYSASYKGYPQPKYSNNAPNGYNNQNYKYGHTLPALKNQYNSNYTKSINPNNNTTINNPNNYHGNKKPTWNNSTNHKSKQSKSNKKGGNYKNGTQFKHQPIQQANSNFPNKNFGVKPHPLPTIKQKKKY